MENLLKKVQNKMGWKCAQNEQRLRIFFGELSEGKRGRSFPNRNWMI